MINHPNRNKTTKRKIGPISVPRNKPRAMAPAHDHDADYAALLNAVKLTFQRFGGQHLFQTDVPTLYETYLSHLGRERSVHTCSACRKFIEAYGTLVAIDDDGHTTSVMWDPDVVPTFYRPAVAAMADKVERRAVDGVFLSKDALWGIPATGDWTHFSVQHSQIFFGRLLTPGQAAAAKREDFKTVQFALNDFAAPTITEAIRILEAGHLARSDHFIAPLQWLAHLHEKRASAKHKHIRDNHLWRAIATAPDGYCHPRAGMTGSLLEDIAAGLPFADVKARFDAKMHPLQYQRPQAAPKAGNIENAEKAVDKLGIRPSLERRFARVDEVQVAWQPFAQRSRPASGGVFGHIKARGASPGISTTHMPAVTMTWEKFSRTVLPGAEAIQVYIGPASMPFIALTTAVHPEAPPILKWDHPKRRNPAAWYVYHGGSSPSQWGLSAGWANVSVITPLPPMWGDEPKPHLGEGYVLVVDGCGDVQKGFGNALFPECLIADLHGVRATIEAYSRSALLSGREGALASGIDVRKGMKGMNYRVRVTVGAVATDYVLDRWD